MEAFRLQLGGDGRGTLQVPYRGTASLQHPMYNKGSSFTAEERQQFDLQGLPPAREHVKDAVGSNLRRHRLRPTRSRSSSAWPPPGSQ